MNKDNLLFTLLLSIMIGLLISFAVSCSIMSVILDFNESIKITQEV